MKNKKRRGISFGTFFVLGLTIIIIAGVGSIFTKMAGDSKETISPQEIASAISSAVDLPDLHLLEIPLTNPELKETLPPVTTEKVLPVENEQNQGETKEEAIISLGTQQPTAIPNTPPPPVQKKTIITLAGTADFTKDIRQSAYNKESQTYDFRHLLGNIQGEIEGDLAIATFENTIVPNKDVNNTNTVPQVLTALKNGGINVLSIGNEHVLDYGLPGVQATESEVRKAGFSLVGANVNNQQNLILDAGDMKLGILHFVDNITASGEKQLKKQENQDVIGIYNEETINQEVAKLRNDGADIVLVMFHWGKDKQKEVTEKQQIIAQQVANAGADILLGTHIQKIYPITYTTGIDPQGKQREMLTVYSIGALLTEERGDANVGGILLHVALEYNQEKQMAEIEEVTYTPTYIWRYKEDGKFQYRVVASDQLAPQGMDEGQEKVKDKILGIVQGALGDSPVSIRVK